MSQSPALATSCVGSEPGPLPSTGITRLPRYYGPVRHPQWPSLAVTGNLLEIPVSTTEDFPCCVRSSSFVHATANTPARLPGARFARFPGSVSLPRIDWQVGPCITLFEACSAFTHVAACTLAKSLYDPLHRRLQPLRYLHDCSDCYRLERKSPGGIRTHWKSTALARRTSNSGGLSSLFGSSLVFFPDRVVARPVMRQEATRDGQRETGAMPELRSGVCAGQAKRAAPALLRGCGVQGGEQAGEPNQMARQEPRLSPRTGSGGAGSGLATGAPWIQPPQAGAACRVRDTRNLAVRTRRLGAPASRGRAPSEEIL